MIYYRIWESPYVSLTFMIAETLKSLSDKRTYILDLIYTELPDINTLSIYLKSSPASLVLEFEIWRLNGG